jgi:hypothetical protein
MCHKTVLLTLIIKLPDRLYQVSVLYGFNNSLRANLLNPKCACLCLNTLTQDTTTVY